MNDKEGKMNRYLYVLVVGLLAILLAGCVTVQKVVRDRVDQDVSGNQGYIQGAGPAAEVREVGPREYIDVKVEIPTMEEVKKAIQKREPETPRQPETAGNRGYIGERKGFEEELPAVSKSTAWPTPPKYREPAEYEEEETVEVEEIIAPATTYKVKEGDSLSKIAKAFYGKASKWTIIYEANSDKIKDPNRLKVGTVLTIPQLKEEKAERGEDIK